MINKIDVSLTQLIDLFVLANIYVTLHIHIQESLHDYVITYLNKHRIFFLNMQRNYVN